MAESSTLTVRLSADVKDQLGVLADRTRRTRSFLAGEAIGAYVRREMEIVAGIERGLEDYRAGRVVDHEQAMDELDEVIERAILRGARAPA